MFEGLLSSTSLPLLGALVALLLFHILYSKFSSKESWRDPPGPKPLPLLGNLLQVDLKRLDVCLCDLAKKYGSVFTVYLGPKKVVVLSGYRTVKEALVNHGEEFGDREVFPVFHDFNKGHGIIFSNGDSWKEMRRFALSTLRDFGMGRRISEEKIIEECHHLVEEFKKHKGEAFSNSKATIYAASNIISALMFGERFDYDDPKLHTMVRQANEAIHLTGSAAIMIYNAFPWLRRFITTWRELMENVNGNTEAIRGIIGKLKKTLNPEASTCFIEAFLSRKQHLEESGIRESHFHDNNLLYCVTNLFGAGTDTTSTTLQWGILLMAKYPHVQEKVQEELRRVVGTRQIGVDDRKNLPFTDAVIHETQRLANIVPLSLPHKTTKDVTFNGYYIKEGTTVFPLLTSVLHDESQWESPLTFNPAHFLDQDGKFVKRDAFLPFSAGRRVCLGESLARMEIFLFLTSLLQCFRFTPPPGVSEEELDLTPSVGLTLTPRPHMLCAVLLSSDSSCPTGSSRS